MTECRIAVGHRSNSCQPKLAHDRWLCPFSSGTRVRFSGELFFFFFFSPPLFFFFPLSPRLAFPFFPSFFCPPLIFSSPFPLPSFLFSFYYSFPVHFLSFFTSCFPLSAPFLSLFPPFIIFSWFLPPFPLLSLSHSFFFFAHTKWRLSVVCI